MKEKPGKDYLKRSSRKREGGIAFLGFALVRFGFSFCVSMTYMAAVRKHVPVEYQVK